MNRITPKTARALCSYPVNPGLSSCESCLLLFLQQTELANVAVGDGLDPGDGFHRRLRSEQVGEAALGPEVFLHRQLLADPGHTSDLPVLRLEHREQTGLLGEPR